MKGFGLPRTRVSTIGFGAVGGYAVLGPLEAAAGVPTEAEPVPARRKRISSCCSCRSLSDSDRAASKLWNLEVKYWTCSVSCWAVAVADGPGDAGGVSILAGRNSANQTSTESRSAKHNEGWFKDRGGLCLPANVKFPLAEDVMPAPTAAHHLAVRTLRGFPNHQTRVYCTLFGRQWEMTALLQYSQRVQSRKSSENRDPLPGNSPALVW